MTMRIEKRVDLSFVELTAALKACHRQVRSTVAEGSEGMVLFAAHKGIHPVAITLRPDGTWKATAVMAFEVDPDLDPKDEKTGTASQ